MTRATSPPVSSEPARAPVRGPAGTDTGANPADTGANPADTGAGADLDLSVQQICEAIEAAAPALDALLARVPDRAPEGPLRVLGSTVRLAVRTRSGSFVVDWTGAATELGRACESAMRSLPPARP